MLIKVYNNVTNSNKHKIVVYFNPFTTASLTKIGLF